MTNFNYFLAAITLLMAFGKTADSVGVHKYHCAVRFPDGFYCDTICESWSILSGNTIRCFISNQGQYERFIARNTAFGQWRFYKVDVTSEEESLCQRAIKGDEFFLNDTQTTCPRLLQRKRYYYPIETNPFYRLEESDDQPNESYSAVNSDFDSRYSMDAICELATSHFCRQRKILHCLNNENCCYTKVANDSCQEQNMSKYGQCYKVLFNVMTSIEYYK